MKVLVKKLHQDVKIPAYAHEGDSGMDLFAEETTVLKQGERKLIGTGIKIAIQKGYEVQVRPKSGLAINHGITVLNTPGTVDSSYRGEIKVILINHGSEDYTIEKGKKIAQMVLCRVETAEIEEAADLDETSRGDRGFGSTGVH